MLLSLVLSFHPHQSDDLEVSKSKSTCPYRQSPSQPERPPFTHRCTQSAFLNIKGGAIFKWSYVLGSSIVLVPTWLSTNWVTLANWMANEVSWKLFPLSVKTVLASTSGSSRNSNRDMVWAVSFFCSSPTRVRDKRILPTSFKDFRIISTWICAWNKTYKKQWPLLSLVTAYNSYFNFFFWITWGAAPIAIILPSN